LLNVILDFGLCDANDIAGNDCHHFLFREAVPQDFQRIRGRFAPGEPSFPVLQRKKVDEMGLTATGSGSAAFVQFISNSFPIRQCATRLYRQESDLLICENVHA
jgi:hypothetical protein